MSPRHTFTSIPEVIDVMTGYRDEETLRRLYCEEGLSGGQIADRYDVTAQTIYNWMEKLGIEREQREVNRASFSTTEDGYELWQAWDGEPKTTRSVLVHRLVAVAQFGFEAVCGNQVHHKTGIKWDNRPSNLTLETPSDHASRHQEGWHTDVCPNCGHELK
ncbi:HNH protein [Halovirus HCTV-5]|uniref:HNH endonuclease n=1 Tax=Halovirus HCTV-5 TaxID=1273748 RepID=UPI0003348D79|nr:HNH endonuclease [Halovirus HCTV-5]AGM11686.1 HNH protein [Halovirus HCTV-5]